MNSNIKFNRCLFSSPTYEKLHQSRWLLAMPGIVAIRGSIIRQCKCERFPRAGEKRMEENNCRSCGLAQLTVFFVYAKYKQSMSSLPCAQLGMQDCSRPWSPPRDWNQREAGIMQNIYVSKSGSSIQHFYHIPVVRALSYGYAPLPARNSGKQSMALNERKQLWQR